MSKIEKELSELDIKPKRNEDRQDFIRRAVAEVAKLSDKEWDELSKPAQDWHNDAVDQLNANAKNLPDFPDVEKEETTSRRRSSKDEDDGGKAEPKVGVVAKVTTKRGKSSTGTIVELDKEVIVLKMGDGSEEEFSLDRVESIEVAGGEAKGDEEEFKPKVGAMVVVTTKRGKEVTGKIVELDKEVIVLKTDDGGEEEFDLDRVGSIGPAGGSDKEETTSRRRSSKDEDDGGKGSDKGEGKRSRSSNDGVSVGTRIKQLIAEDLDVSQDDIAKVLKKEGIEFKENTLQLNFRDCQGFIKILREAKRLK